MFWNLLHSFRDLWSGVSIPTKTPSNPARIICLIRSSSSARLMDASVDRSKGYLLFFIQSIMAGKTLFLSFVVLPMKLSSTRKTLPLHPALNSDSILLYYLLGGFASRPVSVESGNITKLTTKRTTPGILNIHGVISPHLNKAPERGRCLFQIWKGFGRVKPGCFAQCKVLQELGKGDLGLIEDQVINIRIIFRRRREERPSRHDLHLRLFAPVNNLPHRFLLDSHGTDKDVVRPLKVPIGQTRSIHIDKPFLPFVWKH